MSAGARAVDVHAARALLYDLGGVVVHIDFDWIFQRWASLAGVPVEAVRPRFSHSEAYQRYERNEIPLEAYFEALRGELGLDLSDEQLVDGWQRVFGPAYPEVVELVRRLRGRVPQYVLSNTNPKHLEYWSQLYRDALRPFDRVFASCEVGHRKPERAAFELVSREIGVPLEHILFFDDTEANVEGARAVGMQAVLVRSPRDVVDTLAPLLD